MRSAKSSLNSAKDQPGSIPVIVVSIFLTMPALIALSGCASKPEIAIQSYCSIKATELIDMRDRGIRGLSEANKKAVLAGDDNWLRECKLGDRSNSGGPR